MSRVLRFLIACAFVLAVLPVAPSQANVPPPTEPPVEPPNNTLPPGCGVGLHHPDDPLNSASFLACLPTKVQWNKDLVIFAHGYVDPDAPPDAWTLQLVLDGAFIGDIVTSLGYAFAASSYSKNGLAVMEGIADSAELVTILKNSPQFAGIKNVYLVGVSEGGLITALSLEKLPGVYNGGVAACGPIGDFRGQINYLGDFRVLYDYFFPGVLPPTAVDIPAASPTDLYYQWYDLTTVPPGPGPYALAVAASVTKQESARITAQLLKAANAPIDPKDPASVVSTTVGILDYNVRATNDAKATLGGQPFANRYRWYSGSDNDFKLNKEVARFQADQAALNEIAKNYQTTGKLTKPLVALHTTGDPIVPFWHELMYRAKTFAAGTVTKFVNIPVFRYGHCNFKANEALAAFALMVYKATGQIPVEGLTALRSLEPQAEFNLPMTEPAEEGVYQR